MKILQIYTNTRPILAKKPVLVVLEILVVFLLTIFADRLLGVYFGKTLYFKAYTPNITVHYDTSEFKYDAIISSQGLRNEEVSLKKPKNTLRILALGDSFTLGWGVNAEKSWPKQLEGRLRDVGNNVEVINAGVAGAGLSLEVEVCRDYVGTFKPDQIVLGFYSTDDLAQNLVSYSERKRGLSKIVSSTWPNFAKLKQDKYVFETLGLDEKGEIFIQEVWKQRAESETKRRNNILENVSNRVAEDFEAGKLNPLQVIWAYEKPDFWLLVLNKDALSASISATDEFLSQLKECAGDVPVTVFLIPSQELVSKTYHQFRKELGFRVDDELLDFDFDKHLKPIVQNHGFDYISLLSDFRADGCLDCYFPYDSHMTEVGYRRVAEKFMIR